jgi:hypothetical protein
MNRATSGSSLEHRADDVTVFPAWTRALGDVDGTQNVGRGGCAISAPQSPRLADLWFPWPLQIEERRKAVVLVVGEVDPNRVTFDAAIHPRPWLVIGDLETADPKGDVLRVN